LLFIPGVFIGVPFGIIIWALEEKSYIRKFQKDLEQRVGADKVRAAQHAQFQAAEEAKRKAEEEVRHTAQEETRMKKLQQIIKVSNKLAVERIA
jgi:hypothetical protein